MPVKKNTETTAATVAPKLPESTKGRIFLIDAYSFIFRAYHAMARQRPMSTKAGIPTSATYVFVNMLNKLRKDFAPEHIAAVFDVGKTFRYEEAAAMPALRKRDKDTGEMVEVAYAGYKANRAEMPEDLRQQLPYIRQALDVYRIPILSVEGYEADDVIGTLAQKGADAGYAVYVVSSDKDMLQLVDEHVCVLNPPKDNLICDRSKVEELLGVPPELVVDVMALRGDSVDNIPGAPGIGDKGSVELIQQFGSLDSLLERADEVQRKTYRESLQENREMILLSRRLVTIQKDAPIEFEPEKMQASAPDPVSAKSLFTELEFTALAKEFIGEGLSLGETDYRELNNVADLRVLMSNLVTGAVLAVAFEHSEAEEAQTEVAEEEVSESEAPMLAFGAPELVVSKQQQQKIAISPIEGKAGSATIDTGEVGAELKKALADLSQEKAVHDWKLAIHHATNAGIELAGVAHDPMLYAYLLDPTYTSYTLKDLALRRLDLKLSGTLNEAADVTGRLTASLRKEVEDAGLSNVYKIIDLPLVPVLAGMEQIGVKLDCDVLSKMSVRLEREAGAIAEQIYELAGERFNISSPKQLGEVLFKKLNLPVPVKYGKGKKISTAADVLEGLAETYEVPKLVLEYRQLSKLKSTYVDALPNLCRPGTGRLHTRLNQAATATGRLSSTNPNLQNIPIRTELGREIRAAFVAEEGCMLLGADYSQIELRLLAHFSEDPLLVEAYKTGQDIHSLTASQVFGVPPMLIDDEHRRRAKAVNFGIVYGLSPFGLSQQIGISTKEAKHFIDAYFEKYAGVQRFIDATLEQARRDGKVSTLFGRVRPIPDILSKNPNLRGFAERTAVNTPLQGTAADLIKLAMIQIDQDLLEQKLKTKMLLQVHDELVFEVPQNEIEAVRALVKKRMEGVATLRVPLEVEIGVGPNWRDME